MPIPVKIFKIHPEAVIPEYKTSGSCGFDFTIIEDREIQPREIVRLRTGLVFCVPENHVLLITCRSSLPMKRGLAMPHGVGTIDQDFCGPGDELLLQVQNISQTPVEVKKGDRLLQGLIIPISQATFAEVTELANPTRGSFGSTG